MIFYATQKTRERYKLKTPEEMQSEAGPLARRLASRERGSGIYEWGCKLFYFDGRKCLQIMHFTSKLVIFLVDIKMKEVAYAGNLVAHYLMDLYSGDAEIAPGPSATSVAATSSRTFRRYWAFSPDVKHARSRQ